MLLNPKDCLILVVDDLSQNLQIIGEMLERNGYETTFATSGKQALERVEAAHPDLILLDLMMPGMNGLEVCEILKSNPDLCQIPIIFLTASSEKDDLLQAFRKGAADYITKPFRPEEVLIRIETQLTNQYLRKRLQEKNRELEVEIEIRRRTEVALQQAKDIADAANRAKSLFLANMSHELRTPLNAILGFTKLISHSHNLNLEQQKNLAIVYQSGEHLLNLINDILDLSKIEAGRITVNKTKFNPLDLLLEIKELFWLQAKEKELQLVFDISPHIPGGIESDRVKLRQILTNLLGNAIKFTKAGRVRLKADVESTPHTPQIHFEISDTGVGIAPHELEKLFQPFVQTEAGIVSAEGTGLGLVISRKYVQLLGGDIQVTSHLGQGTTFSFSIPLIPVEEIALQSPLSTRRVIGLASDQPAYRILVADDKLSNRELLMQILAGVGFEVRGAANGQEVIEIWERFNPHLIWMDMRMSVMNGYETTQKIKSHPNGKETVIVALTANLLDEDKKRIFSVGCQDVVCKPFQESIVFEKINQLLGVRYIYEEDAYAARQLSSYHLQELLKLNALPPALISQFEAAALELNEEVLYQLISQLSPEYASLVEALKACVDNFELDKILETIESKKREASPPPKSLE